MIPIVLFACSFACAIAGKVPDYINRCHYSESTISQCILDNVQNAIPHFKDGIKSLHLPPLVPFYIKELTLEPSNGLFLNLKNLELYGFDKINITELKIANPNMVWRINFPELRFVGDIDINGKLLILPIQGNCHCFITLEDFSLDFSLTFREEDRKGKQYFVTDNHKITYVAKKLKSDLEKLFNDPTLGTQLKQFIEENWQQINDEFRPVISDVIILLVKNLIDGVTNSMPLNELFIV